MPVNLVPGYATRAGTEHYAQNVGRDFAKGHYSDFLNLHLKLSSLGLGTFPGAATEDVDHAYVEVIYAALKRGINVIDTASHYRYGRSEAALGSGLKKAFAAGVERNQVFIISKGGFCTFVDGKPKDFKQWFAEAITRNGLGEFEDCTGTHLLSPSYLAWQLERSRQMIGVETLDAYLVDQPEVHIPAIGKQALHSKLKQAFVVLEQAVKQGKIKYYGISTYEGFRVQTDEPLFLSLASLQAIAQQAAHEAHQNAQAKHSFKVIELPFNQAMLEGFTRFNQATGQGNVGSTIQAAFQLKIFVVASHTLLKGHLGQHGVDALNAAMPHLATHAQRALDFNRSTPGIGVSLVGITAREHLDDVLRVAQHAPLPRPDYLKLYERAVE